jgi:hypothetical protein
MGRKRVRIRFDYSIHLSMGQICLGKTKFQELPKLIASLYGQNIVKIRCGKAHSILLTGSSKFR